jgi:hypothetical protein
LLVNNTLAGKELGFSSNIEPQMGRPSINGIKKTG